jgi:hypothetical protein
MSRTYRRMKTERGRRTPRQEARKNKRVWKDSRIQTIEIREKSNARDFETV